MRLRMSERFLLCSVFCFVREVVMLMDVEGAFWVVIG